MTLAGTHPDAAVLPARHTLGVRRTRLLVGLGSFALATVLALGFGEAYLRRFAPVRYRAPVWPRTREAGFHGVHQFSSVPGLEYELAPGRTTPTPYFGDFSIHVNAHGLRGPETSLEKPAGAFRIACVGDSFTFGQGVMDEETYPAALQARLDPGRGQGRFEVLNFGVCGYSTSDEAVQVSRRVLGFAPDVILLGYVFNDPEEHPAHELHMSFHERRLWERSHLARFVAKALWDRAQGRAGGYFELLHARDGSYWPSVERGFASIARSAGDANVPVVVMIFPLAAGTRWKRYPYEPLHRQVAELAEASGFGVLDLLPPLRERVHVPDELHLATDTHFNPGAYRLVAELIERELAQRFPRAFAGASGRPTR